MNSLERVCLLPRNSHRAPRGRPFVRRQLLFKLAGLSLSGVVIPAIGNADTTTYHGDAGRTGWNAAEKSLNIGNVGSPEFGLLHKVPLDDQVDAQPLVVTKQPIKNQGTHDVVYVVTENNTVYAIDALTGNVLTKVNLGAPVPQNKLPGGCGNNASNIGIASTPVIDAASGTLYIIVYSLQDNTPGYHLHALGLEDLADKVSPVPVAASQKLSDGTTYTFRAERPASGQRCWRPMVTYTLPSLVFATWTRMCRAAGCWAGRPERWSLWLAAACLTSKPTRKPRQAATMTFSCRQSGCPVMALRQTALGTSIWSLETPTPCVPTISRKVPSGSHPT